MCVGLSRRDNVLQPRDNIKEIQRKRRSGKQNGFVDHDNFGIERGCDFQIVSNLNEIINGVRFRRGSKEVMRARMWL